MNSLAGKRAIVTGGASGIGYATAEALAAAGVLPILLDVDVAAGERAARSLDLPFIPIDVADASAWTEVVARIDRDYGRLDIAFLNAGVRGGPRLIEELAPEQLTRALGVNLAGVTYGVRYCFELLARNGGAIVVTASIAGLRASVADPVYGMTKHGVIGLMRSLAPQLAERNISINAVCPTVTDTPMVRSNAEVVEQFRTESLTMLEPVDIAHAVVSLLRSGGTGQAVVCRVGHVPAPWDFPAPDESTAAPLPR
ncbi:MAG TPA: SDR family oxidoreductase [Acidimicrobiales bacterium]|nr:SDR family oxidoreductase [Acidimicrobiales bacterium]